LQNEYLKSAIAELKSAQRIIGILHEKKVKPNNLKNYSYSNSKKILNERRVGFLHHNVQSLSNKVIEMQLLLDSWPEKPAVVCFSEHWLPSDHLIHINIDQYKLADKYCRNSDKHGVPAFLY
jgi:CHAD domain-containing protein